MAAAASRKPIPQRKIAQLERFGSDERKWNRLAERAEKKGRVLKELYDRRKVISTNFLGKQRVVKRAAFESDAWEIASMRALRANYFDALKRGIINPKTYKLGFGKVGIAAGRIVVSKQEKAVPVLDIIFKNENAVKFIREKGINTAEVRRAFRDAACDVRIALECEARNFDENPPGQNFLVKGKTKDGRIALVLIDQPGLYY